MTDRELLESILLKVTVNESKIAKIEVTIDEFIKEYYDRLYGFARDENKISE